MKQKWSNTNTPKKMNTQKGVKAWLSCARKNVEELLWKHVEWRRDAVYLFFSQFLTNLILMVISWSLQPQRLSVCCTEDSFQNLREYNASYAQELILQLYNNFTALYVILLWLNNTYILHYIIHIIVALFLFTLNAVILNGVYHCTKKF